MKRSLILIFTLSFVLALWIAPHILTSSPQVTTFVKDAISKELNVQADFDDLVWYWLPLPHLSFVSVEIDAPEYLLNASNVDIYPDWLRLFKGEVGIYGIGLEDAHVKILMLPKGKNKRPPFPRWIKVTNGFFEIAKGMEFPFFFPFKDRRPYIKNLYGQINFWDHKLSAKLSGNTRQAQTIDLHGQMDLESLAYELKGSIKQFDLSALKIRPLTNAKRFPNYGFINLDFNIKGQGLEDVDGQLKAYSNCFVSGTKPLSAIFSCGSLEAKFKYHADQIQVMLQNLEFQHPKLRMYGKLVLEKRQTKPWLHMELKGRALDLAEIRRVLLAMSIKDKDVDDYCNAIRSGTVEWITVTMHGPASKWHSLSDMNIQGRAKDVKVYIKDEDFFVDSASGPFEIVDGILHVENGRAHLRNTVATSGTLVLGLARGREQFKLGLELIAPANDVRWALLKFTKEDQLHEELKRLSNLKGRLKGRLEIGDTKHDKSVKIYVRDARISAFHQGLGMRMNVAEGQARYADDTLSLICLSGTVGPNHISDLSATISWRGNKFIIKVDKGSGRVLTQSIIALCQRFEIGQDFLNSHNVVAKGLLRINRAKLYLDLTDPSTLDYLLAISPAGVDLETDLLPFPVHLAGGRLSVSADKVSATGFKVKMAGNLYQLWAGLRHRRFRNWTGFVKARGGVNKRVWSWFEQKGLDLGEFTPRLPFYADDFKVEFVSGKPMGLDGKILWKKQGASLVLKAKKGMNFLRISKLMVTKGPRSASISFQRSKDEKPSLSFAFKGELSKDMFQSVLMKNSFLDGIIKGDFAFKFAPFLAKRPIFWNGRLHVQGVRWLWGLDGKLIFNNLDLYAKNGNGNIKANINFMKDLFDLNGTIESVSGRLKAHLRLLSPLFSSRFVSYIQQISETKKDQNVSKVDTGDETDSLFKEIIQKISLKMDFDIKEARYAVTDFAKNRDEAAHEIILKNLKGSASLSQGMLNRLEAYSDDTCGLDLYLKKERLNDQTVSEFSAITPKGKRARFEQVLDCLGIEQDLITGPVVFNLYLRGGNRVLLGNGNLRIKAKDGYIHKFGLLSKIFSVVNIIDIFSLNKGLLEGTSPYKKLLVDAKIRSGKVHMEKAYIKGPGINFYGTGDVYLNNKLLDLIIFIQPLKTVDKIITSLPIIGGIIGGENKSLFAIPVKVSGNWSDPKIDTLQTKTVTDIFKKLIFNVLTAPFNIKN